MYFTIFTKYLEYNFVLSRFTYRIISYLALFLIVLRLNPLNILFIGNTICTYLKTKKIVTILVFKKSIYFI